MKSYFTVEMNAVVEPLPPGMGDIVFVGKAKVFRSIPSEKLSAYSI